MAVFRFESRYAAPSREQRERYMKGEYEEHAFGPEGKILLVAYDEAIYIKDEIDDVRLLFTGVRGREEAYEEVRRLVERHAAFDGEGPGE